MLMLPTYDAFWGMTWWAILVSGLYAFCVPGIQHSSGSVSEHLRRPTRRHNGCNENRTT